MATRKKKVSIPLLIIILIVVGGGVYISIDAVQRVADAFRSKRGMDAISPCLFLVLFATMGSFSITPIIRSIRSLYRK